MPLEYQLGLLLLALVSAAILIWQERVLSRRIGVLAAQMERTAAVHSELRWCRRAQARLSEWQDVTHSTIEGGTKAARALHQGIAAIPFEILESIPATRHSARMVRTIHDFTADNVYAAISAVNRLVGDKSRDWVSGKPKIPAKASRSPADDPERNDP